MCCLCNWSKGNGEKPFPFMRKKYPKGYLDKSEVSDIKIGDFVYKKSNKKYVPLGIVSDILINDKHPEKALSAKIKGNETSMYDLKSLIVGESLPNK